MKMKIYSTYYMCYNAVEEKKVSVRFCVCVQ